MRPDLRMSGPRWKRGSKWKSFGGIKDEKGGTEEGEDDKRATYASIAKEKFGHTDASFDFL